MDAADTADIYEIIVERHRAAATGLTSIFGVGPVVAATIIGDAGDVTRFPTADRFAACNGTAPIEVSSGKRKIYRLSRRGNRRMNHCNRLTTSVRPGLGDDIDEPLVPRIRPPHGRVFRSVRFNDGCGVRLAWSRDR